jgi:hypothetical protein
MVSALSLESGVGTGEARFTLEEKEVFALVLERRTRAKIAGSCTLAWTA